MKTVIGVSLGPSKQDYEFKTKYLGQNFHIKHFGTDGDTDRAAQLIKEWDGKANSIGIGGIGFTSRIGLKKSRQQNKMKLQKLTANIETPTTTGEAFRNVAQEWVIRYIQFKEVDFFNNSQVLFLSGIINYSMASVLSAYTDNITYADPIIENGIPKFLGSLKDLERYTKGIHQILKMTPSKFISSKVGPVRNWTQFIIRKAMQKASIIVVPYYNFWSHMDGITPEELGGKTVITSVAYDNRVEVLKDNGVDLVIDSTPKILNRVLGFNMIEALITAALDKRQGELTDDDLLEVISSEKIHPRMIYTAKGKKRINRFAFVIHPLSQAQLKKDKRIKAITDAVPLPIINSIEKIMAYSPPFVYSKVSGVKSPTGVEAEGWLISVGGTPKQMLAHPPEFTYKRLLAASRMAKRMGAQIMGLGAFTKVVGDAGVTVAKLADIPVTTGNSYSASGALWAATDAARRMGLIKESKRGKKLKAKSMVIGSTGAIGSVCARLLAMAFEEVYIIGRNIAKLLALKESILKETPKAKVITSIRADKYLGDMDMIVTATSAAGKKILDIMKVKPGCIVTDVARPLDLSAEDVAKRPDVLVVESGEIELPGADVKMGDIGLPPGVAYACLAETIVLTLEGRFEIFTIGRDIEWQKVKEIFKLGLKHGMKLASISGVNGIYSDEDIMRVRNLALESRGEPAG